MTTQETSQPLLSDYLRNLKGLRFVRAATLRRGGAPDADALLQIDTPDEKYLLQVELKTSHLDRAGADPLVHRMAKRGPGWILMAPAVGTALGQSLASRGVNYIDRQGNCHLALGERYFAQVEGRRPLPTPARDKSVRAPGYQTLFALLARPALINEPLRTIAAAANVSRQAAVDALTRLTDDGVLLKTKRGLLWDPRGWNKTVDHWLVGYRDAMRPRLLLGRYRPPERDPEALERRIRPTLDALGGWRWGGSAAGFRLTKHYRGPRTVVHLHGAHPLDDLPRRLKAAPDPEGPLVLLRTPGEVAFDGRTDDTVHPLLAYAEMVVEGDERAMEAAAELRERFLTPP